MSRGAPFRPCYSPVRHNFVANPVHRSKYSSMTFQLPALGLSRCTPPGLHQHCILWARGIGVAGLWQRSWRHAVFISFSSQPGKCSETGGRVGLPHGRHLGWERWQRAKRLGDHSNSGRWKTVSHHCLQPGGLTRPNHRKAALVLCPHIDQSLAYGDGLINRGVSTWPRDRSSGRFLSARCRTSVVDTAPCLLELL